MYLKFILYCLVSLNRGGGGNLVCFNHVYVRFVYMNWHFVGFFVCCCFFGGEFLFSFSFRHAVMAKLFICKIFLNTVKFFRIYFFISIIKSNTTLMFN